MDAELLGRIAQDLELVDQVQTRLVGDLRSQVLDPSSPSRLSGWTVGRLLSHIARNADSVTRRLDASARGERIDQYVGGAAARAAEIEHGAHRTYEDLCADVESSSAVLLAAARVMPEGAWTFATTAVSGIDQAAHVVLRRRVREVVLHHSDLNIGFEPDQWPSEVVNELLLEGLPMLSSRTEPSALAGWLTGRASAPELAPFA